MDKIENLPLTPRDQIGLVYKNIQSKGDQTFGLPPKKSIQISKSHMDLTIMSDGEP